MSNTANVAKPMDSSGELYQRRAFAALPLLVRQAAAGQTIFYSALAAELGMDNPRNLNFVLGSVGASLAELSRAWASSIPPLQALVVNKATRLPGEGFVEFVPDPESYKAASPRLKRQIIAGLLTDVFRFSRWNDVLQYFGAPLPPPPDIPQMLPSGLARAFGGAGESPMHQSFKEYVARNPSLFGLSHVTVEIEHSFPSGDAVDVLFTTANAVVAVEVKSYISPDEDILRGVFQCVKYAALLEATVSLARAPVEARVVLALERSVPPSVLPIANTLGIEFVQNVRPTEGPT